MALLSMVGEGSETAVSATSTISSIDLGTIIFIFLIILLPTLIVGTIWIIARLNGLIKAKEKYYRKLAREKKDETSKRD